MRLVFNSRNGKVTGVLPENFKGELSPHSWIIETPTADSRKRVRRTVANWLADVYDFPPERFDTLRRREARVESAEAEIERRVGEIEEALAKKYDAKTREKIAEIERREKALVRRAAEFDRECREREAELARKREHTDMELRRRILAVEKEESRIRRMKRGFDGQS